MTPRKSAHVRLPPYPATRNGSADRFWTASTCSWKCRRWNTRSRWTKRQPKTPATPGKGWNRPVTFSGSGSRTAASYVTQRRDRRKSGNRAPERKLQVPAPSSNPTTQPLRQSIPPDPESLPHHRRPRRRPRHRRLPPGRGVTVPVEGICGVGGQATRRRSESVRGS